jgi:HEAT repeat protein
MPGVRMRAALALESLGATDQETIRALREALKDGISAALAGVRISAAVGAGANGGHR